MAEKAKTAEISVKISCLLGPTVPKRGLAHIDQQHNRPLALFLKDFNVRLSRAGRHIPINASDVIAKLVLPHLAERHARPLKAL